jgi:Tol biopolymer transport system component
MRLANLFLILLCIAAVGVPAERPERQITFSPRNHALDNNDNFSRGDRFLCYDTRVTRGVGNGCSTSIMKVELATGVENVVYEPKPIILGPIDAAPGVIAASYNPVADEIVFIHGPLVSETPKIGFYGITNRRGAVVAASGGKARFLDYRDVFNETTTPGAHRGGTHRHEFSLDGKRIGFTYDDHILTNYGRTVGMMMASPKAPAGVTHWMAILVPIAPKGAAKPGELEFAGFDSWVGQKGLMRAFIGKVKEPSGDYTTSLFVVDVPENVDITTSYSGTRARYLAPPKGVTVRRLTHQQASGIARGSRDGKRIAYFAKDANGVSQVFLIDSHGSDQDSNPALHPVQATFFKRGVKSGLRWHPSDNTISVVSDNGVAAVCVKPGPLFGKTYFLTPRGATLAQVDAPVWSNSGKQIAYNRRVPTKNEQGLAALDAGGRDFLQIFVADFPDANNNGIADPLESGIQ